MAPDARRAYDRAADRHELRDATLHEEIELVGHLVVIATSATHRLSQQEIDRVLGVVPTP